tara:strand:+ start:219 stop:395 length:177 start_codon:yes stop_codon:yes gene_type:complete
MTKESLQLDLAHHLDRVDVLTHQAKLCRKLSNKLLLLASINHHARLATEIRGELNGWA